MEKPLKTHPGKNWNTLESPGNPETPTVGPGRLQAETPKVGISRVCANKKMTLPGWWVLRPRAPPGKCRGGGRGGNWPKPSLTKTILAPGIFLGTLMTGKEKKPETIQTRWTKMTHF